MRLNSLKQRRHLIAIYKIDKFLDLRRLLYVGFRELNGLWQKRAFNVAAVVVGIPVFVQHHSACFGAHLTAFADGWRCVLKASEAASE